MVWCNYVWICFVCIYGHEKSLPMFLFLYLFLLASPVHVEIPRPGTEPKPQQWPEPLQWQYWILKLLCHKRISFFFFFFFVILFSFCYQGQAANIKCWILFSFSPWNFCNEYPYFFLKWLTAKIILRTKKRNGGTMLPDFRPYYKATVMRKLWHWHKNRYIDEWNRIESPEIDHIYSPQSYDKGAKNIKWRRTESFNNWCWKTGQLHIKEWNYNIF